MAFCQYALAALLLNSLLFSAEPPDGKSGDHIDARSIAGSSVKSRKTNGPLQVHRLNSRYLADQSGRVVFLAGNQIYNDLQDYAWNAEKPTDWAGFLDVANEYNFNYLRSWTVWSTGRFANAVGARLATPMPYQRTGPGLAHDGGLKFDLDKWDDAFFQRLHDRVTTAGERGIYVSLMLFDVYCFITQKTLPPDSMWTGNVFHEGNNINGVKIGEYPKSKNSKRQRNPRAEISKYAAVR